MSNHSVYDTKYISAMHPLCRDMAVPEFTSLVPLPTTCLENLVLWARQSQRDAQLKLCMSLCYGRLIIALHHKHIRYGVHEQHHEAGYDALLTAQVFLALTAEMMGPEKSQVKELTGFPNIIQLNCR
jgi:hypothetical protein